MERKRNYLILFLVVLSLSCSKEQETATDFSIINLKWNKSYPNQTREDAVKGLNWTLSNIGVSIKSNDYLEVSDNIMTLNINALSLEDGGREPLLKLHESIFNSQEYILNNNIDLGRYVCLLIGASNHYFELVQIPNALHDVLSNYQLLPVKGKINNSSVSYVDRVVEYSNLTNGKQLFLSTEIDSVTDSVYEYETIEIMKNGQLKFGVYGKNGLRKNSSDPLITDAGKMAKCMWCHESNYAPLINRQLNEPGYLLAQQLDDTIKMYQQKLFTYQTKLTNSVVKYGRLQEHTKMELLYMKVTFQMD